MNKGQLIEMLGMRAGMEKKMAAQAVDAMFDIIVRNVNNGENVTLTGFGVFEKRARAARTARNPRTGQTLRLRKTNVPNFRPGMLFKEVVDGTRKLPRATAMPAAKPAAKAVATRSTAAKPAAKAMAKRATAVRSTTRAAAKPAAKATTTRAAAKPAAKATRSTAKPAAKATAKASRPATKKAATVKKTAVAKKTTKAKPTAKKGAKR
ncbi:MAG TPA: HU family DNA-binding protein [Kutzneria sp.]|nr:HU family DNA-binding protein [Kutzneria sp.]